MLWPSKICLQVRCIGPEFLILFFLKEESVSLGCKVRWESRGLPHSEPWVRCRAKGRMARDVAGRLGLAEVVRGEDSEQSSSELWSFKCNVSPPYYAVSFMLVILYLPPCIMFRRESAQSHRKSSALESDAHKFKSNQFLQALFTTLCYPASSRDTKMCEISRATHTHTLMFFFRILYLPWMLASTTKSGGSGDPPAGAGGCPLSGPQCSALPQPPSPPPCSISPEL